MTPEEYNANLTDLIGLISGDLAADTIAVSGAELLIQIKQRITQEGRNSNDKVIGDYSTKPIYAQKQVFIKGGFVAQGKRNVGGNTIGDRIIQTNKILVIRNAAHLQNGTFITGKQTTPSKGGGKKTARFDLVKGNYQPRKTMYLKDGYKELRDIQGLRTDTMNLYYRGDLINDYQMVKEAQTVLLGLVTQKSADKRKGLEDRFGNIFYATVEERETYINRTNFLLARLTRNTLQGYHAEAEID